MSTLLWIVLVLLVAFYGIALSRPGKWMDWAAWKAHIHEERRNRKS